MDAVEFLDKVDRLSKRGFTEEKMRYTDYRAAGDNVGAVKFVERWAVAHPTKTRQSVFLEQYPKAKLTEDGVLALCPIAISSECSGENGRCVSFNRKCGNCRREFWSAEVEDA